MLEERKDVDVKHDVIESLYWDARIDAAGIGVLVRAGRVTLVGSVPTYRARRAAREDAEIVSGVVHVDNQLEVEISAALDTPRDEDLAAAVEDVFASDPDLGAVDVDVAATDGVVRLSGSVRTFWEKEMAAAVAGTLPGVRALENALAVIPSRTHEDEAIADAVIAALRRNRHVDLSRIDVEVIEGCVVLAGQVPDEPTRQQVLDAARYTAGVTDVRDHLLAPGQDDGPTAPSD